MKKILGLGVVAVALSFGVWGLLVALQQDAEAVARREALPSMEQVEAIEVNNQTVHLWAFDFEGKRCLWATTALGRTGYGGLTCWEDK